MYIIVVYVGCCQALNLKIVTRTCESLTAQPPNCLGYLNTKANLVRGRDKT